MNWLVFKHRVAELLIDSLPHVVLLILNFLVEVMQSLINRLSFSLFGKFGLYNLS